MKRAQKRLALICCLMAIFLTATACGKQPVEPVQQEPSVVDEPEGLQEPSVITPKPPRQEPEKKQEEQLDVGYLRELEVHCEQYGELYHLWVETDKETMQTLTVKQYQNYDFGTGARGGVTQYVEIDGEQQTVYWTTFVFPDGTGLCWHGGNWRWGSYGVLDEGLRIPEPLYYIGSEEDGDKEVTITPWTPPENDAANKTE